MAQFTKNNKRNPLERTSSQGLVLGCPICAAKLDLLDTRDGDQAYWCHRCQSGWRAGNLPEAAHRSKDKQSVNLEPPIETSAAVEPIVTQKTRVAKSERAAPAAPSAPRNNAKPPAAQVIAPKPRAPTSEPKTVALKTSAPPKPASPKRAASPRAAEIAVSPPKAAAPKKAAPKAQKKSSLETRPKDLRRTSQIVAPISKPLKAKRQPLEETSAPAARGARAGVQKPQNKPSEVVASAPQPRRLTRPPLETSLPRGKRSKPEEQMLVTSGKLAAPAPKAATGKRQPLEVAAKPKISAPRADAQKAQKKTLETAAPIKASSRREKPALETSKGVRKAGQTAALSPKTATGKRQKLEVAAPNISARVTVQKPQKKTLETAVPAKPTRRKKPVLEITAVAPQRTRQRKLAPAVEPTPKPRRAARVFAPVKPARAAPEQRTSPVGKALTAPVTEARAKRPTAPLEPIAQSRRATRVPAQPTPAPVKPRTPRVTQLPVAVAPVRPKPARSSPARPAPAAPSNPAQFGLFDTLPPKTAGRRSAKS